MLYHVWLMLFFGGLSLAVGASHRWHSRALAALHAAELRRVTSQQSLSQAKLKRLEACINPTYLFQALARLEKLYADNSPGADVLLDRIIAFLRRALTESRAFLHQEVP
jgi:LytS/YehU family sensor histidine kinase